MKIGDGYNEGLGQSTAYILRTSEEKWCKFTEWHKCTKQLELALNKDNIAFIVLSVYFIKTFK